MYNAASGLGTPLKLQVTCHPALRFTLVPLRQGTPLNLGITGDHARWTQWHSVDVLAAAALFAFAKQRFPPVPSRKGTPLGLERKQ